MNTNIRNFWNVSVGEKFTIMEMADIQGIVTCPVCNGSGVIVDKHSNSPDRHYYKCGKCYGDGVISTRRRPPR